MIYRLGRSAYFLAVLCAGVIFCTQGQPKTQTQEPSLQGFYEALLQNPSQLPKHEDLHALTNRIDGSMSAEEVKQGLPTVLSALAYPSAQVKFLASAALFAVAGRPDGSKLLHGYVDAIGRDLLSVQDERLQNGEIIILGRIRPTPPEVVPLLLDFLQQPDRGDGARAGAVLVLVQIAPDNPRFTSETLHLLSRPLDSPSRIGILNALGNPKITDPRLISAVITDMSASDEGVRSAAIQAVTRMGKKAVEQAEPALRRLTSDPNQPAEIVSEAKEALKLLAN